jgi:hypothetical protein
MKCKFRYQNRFKNVYVQNQKYEEIEREREREREIEENSAQNFIGKRERESRERKKLRDVR